MNAPEIVVSALTAAGFVGVGVFAYFNAIRIPWPKGPRMKRKNALGVELVVINTPGSDGEKLLLVDACATATTSIFTAWRSWRPFDVGAETVFSLVGVHFVDDAVMDRAGESLLFTMVVPKSGQSVSAFLSDASSKCKRVPLVLIRKSLAGEVIKTGQPLIHELLHALLNHFTPNAPGIHDHTALAWELVQAAAVETFKGLYAPVGGQEDANE